jgi:hypothetical protein
LALLELNFLLEKKDNEKLEMDLAEMQENEKLMIDLFRLDQQEKE